MYRYVGSDGNLHPADLDRLKEWAQLGYVEPYAPVINTATGKQTRADALPDLQPIFAARFEAIAQQTAATTASAAAKASQSRKTSTYGAWGSAAVAIILIAVIRSVIADRPYHRPRTNPPLQQTNPSPSFSEAKPDYLPGPMPEKERQRIYWEIGMTSANAEIASDKRFPLVRLPRNPSRRDLARDAALRKRSFAFFIDLEKKNKKQLVKKTKLSQDELDLIFNEGMEKKWPFPYKELPVVVKNPAHF